MKEERSKTRQRVRPTGKRPRRRDGVSSSRSGGGPTPDTSAVFVGREWEVAALVSALEEAHRGRGRLVLVSGEPGVGKTRLVEHLATKALDVDARVLWGRCWGGGGAPVYWPWGEIVRTLAREWDDGTLLECLGEDASRLAELVPELRQRLPPVTALRTLESESLRFALMTATVRFLEAAAADRTLVLLLDDLHAADASALRLFSFLAREIGGTRILLIGMVRDVGSHPVPSLAEIGGPASQLRLNGFTLEECNRYLKRTVGVATEDSLARRIHDATGGNPLFVSEIVRLLLARGGALESVRKESLPIPAGLRETFRRRFASLSARCRETLALASAFGREFEIAALSTVGGTTVDEVSTILSEATSEGLLEEVSPSLGRFAFVHDVVRETLYQDLPYARRLEAHRAIGAALERLYAANPEPHVNELAFHTWRSAAVGDPAKAADYAVRAGDRAAAVSAHDEAADHFEHALDLVGRGIAHPAQRFDILERLAQARGRGGDAEGSRSAFREAAGLARDLGDVDRLARAALGVAGGGFGGLWAVVHSESEPLAELLEEALERLPPNRGVVRARLLARLATALHYAPDPERRASLSREALELARATGDRSALAFTLGARHYALCGPAEVGARLAIADEIVRLAERVRDRELELQGRAFRIADLVEGGELPRASREIEAYTSLAEQLRQPFYVWYAVVWRGMGATAQGRFAEAETLARDALAIGRHAQEDNAVHTFGAQMVPVRWLRGDFEEAIADVQRLVAQYPGFAGWRYTLALLYAEAGQTNAACREVGPDARAQDGRHIHAGFRMLLTAFLAETCAAVRDREWASRLYEELRPYASRTLVDGHDAVACFGSVSHPLGRLAATMGMRAAAARHFDEAIASHEAMGARPFLARSLFESARLLLEDEDREKRERALERAGRALAIAEELGMKHLAKALRALVPGTRSGLVPHPAIIAPTVPTENSASGGSGVFRREGRYWQIRWGGESVRLKDGVGFRYLAELLRNPGRPIHLSELAACVAVPSERSAGTTGRAQLTDAGEVIDTRAKAAYRARLEELRASLTEARAGGDAEAGVALETEIDALTREIARAVGLGGRARRAGSERERLRVRVTKAIRSTIRKVEEASPSLGHHLQGSVRTGAFCSYTPDPSNPPQWDV